MQSFLSPMENSLLAASTPVAIASGIFVAQRLSNVVGRVPAILAFRCAVFYIPLSGRTSRKVLTIVHLLHNKDHVSHECFSIFRSLGTLAPENVKEAQLLL